MSNDFRRYRNAALAAAAGSFGRSASRDAYLGARKFFSGSNPNGPPPSSIPWTRRGRRNAKYAKYNPRQEIGHQIGPSSARVKEVDLGTSDPTSRTLNTVDLLNILKTDGTFKMDSRFRDVIDISGVRLTYTLANLNTAAAMMVNVAIVATRDNNTGTVNLSNFFRGDSGNDRADDFSTALDANLFYHSPINTDDYIVLYRKKYIITPDTKVVTKNDYIKINRQVRYTSTGDPHQGLRLIYWYTSANSVGGGPATGNLLRVGMRALTFFHDKN